MRKVYVVILIWIICSCREKFVPGIVSPPTGYLVVEGIINSGEGATNITLSRTNPVSTDTLTHERGATVQVEGEDNGVFNLIDEGTGLYSIDQLHLDNSQKYRLHIKTLDGKEYVSDFMNAIVTPAIDSVSWRDSDDAVEISVSTHDSQNDSRYYYWTYDETWEFHSPFNSFLAWDTIKTPAGIQVNVRSVPADTTIQKCWVSQTAPNILITTTAKLSEDIVSNFLLAEIPHGSVKISVLYSALVSQYVITKDAYDFLQRMKKNTEQVGSIFDPQPSELKGNIRCTNDPGSPVIGFASITSRQTKRIFIRNSDFSSWGYKTSCLKDTIVDEQPINLFRTYAGIGWVPLNVVAGSSRGASSVEAALPVCVDCTLTGTNKKPAFWPQ
jgi:hypothetical protein